MGHLLLNPSNEYILSLHFFFSSLMLVPVMRKKKSLKSVSVSLVEDIILVIVFPCAILINKYTF